MMWTFEGNLNCGEAIYRKKNGDLAIEKDLTNLVNPTPEERAEIYKRMPHLMPKKQEGS